MRLVCSSWQGKFSCTTYRQYGSIIALAAHAKAGQSAVSQIPASITAQHEPAHHLHACSLCTTKVLQPRDDYAGKLATPGTLTTRSSALNEVLNCCCFIFTAAYLSLHDRQRQQDLMSGLEAELMQKLQQLQLLAVENQVLRLRGTVLEAAVAGRDDVVSLQACYNF
jgi:hypothetical protein